ncbi:MAG: hypothetical protein A2932_00935 [Candidatus Spechtbacteria bacterium RIFCSPLOWO2_01_FULL_46_10]|uniref:SHS2 domain-containing protein n=1 Tax=Candidatus Spechtbacteria bacterium RIFCSPLOWO2_01_FULL_46_10 TaxID=1802163 RepID=A0A1G2HFE0_9BACT|nr:MAG: hypothetical protein A2932_00935 [Candidatus Spechtbacteria bacterium RIFCSPLOWO2_01_FULL_46_10]
MKFIVPKLENYFKIVPAAFGLDISDSSIKFAHISSRWGKFSLVAYGERELTEGTIKNGELKKEADFTDKIRDIFQNHKDLPHYAFVGLMEENMFIKAFQLPKMEPAAIRSEILVDAENNIPISLDKAVFDYAVLPRPSRPTGKAGRPADGKSEMVTVIFGAVRKDIVTSYTKAFDKLGISVLGFEPESFAIERSVIDKKNSDKSVLIVEIGATKTRLIVHALGSVVLTGSALFSAITATEMIMKKLKTDKAEAEELLWSGGAEIEKVLTPMGEELAKEISGYISFFNTRRERENFPFGDVSTVLLSGGGANAVGIDKLLSAELGLTVKRANPFINTPGMKNNALDKQHALRYSAALGLALRGTWGIR